MKNLWRKTWELFREHPVLWLPLVCAELSAFCLNRLDGFLNKRIFDWFLAGRSIFDEDFLHPIDRVAVWKATAFSWPFGCAIYMVDLCLYTAAFVLTAMLVKNALRHQRPNLTVSLTALRSYPKRIFYFSLKIIALVAIMAGLMYLPMTYLWPVALTYSRLAGLAFPYGASFLEWVCIAWLMTPVGIRLLQPLQSPSIAAESIKLGRIFTILAILATNAFWYMIQWGEQTTNSALDIGRGPQRLLIDAIGSLLRVFPCVLLFISLSLLITAEKQESEIETNSDCSL